MDELSLPLLLVLAFCVTSTAQQSAQSPGTQTQAAPSVPTDTQQRNVQEYIELLRSDVRHQKDEVMGAVMQLDADQAAKFWPIYSEYDAELNKLNDQRVANIQDYASNYDQMTDAKADELVREGIRLPQAACRARDEILWPRQGIPRIDRSRPVPSDRRAAADDHRSSIASSLPIVGQGS